MTRTYRCRSCGATWVSYPAGEAIERSGRCLRCDGIMVLEQDTAEDRADPSVPNGLEDDAET